MQDTPDQPRAQSSEGEQGVGCGLVVASDPFGEPGEQSGGHGQRGTRPRPRAGSRCFWSPTARAAVVSLDAFH